MFLTGFVTSQGLFLAKVCAASLVVSLPVLIAGFAAQDKLVRVFRSAPSSSRRPAPPSLFRRGRDDDACGVCCVEPTDLVVEQLMFPHPVPGPH